MGSLGKLTYTVTDASGDIRTGLTSVYIIPAGKALGGGSAINMTDSDSNGTYIVDLEDAGIYSGLWDIYVGGTKEIDSFVLTRKDTINSVAAHGISITSHQSSITSLISGLASATGDISSLSGSVSSLVTEVNGLSSAFNTHISSAPLPGATLSAPAFRSLSGSINVRLQASGNNGDVIIENYGSPSGYDTGLLLKRGGFKFVSDLKIYPSSYTATADLVIDVKDTGATSKMFVINSAAGKVCRVVIDGGLSADVDEVVTARSNYDSLNERLISIETHVNEVPETDIWRNMSLADAFANYDAISSANRIHIMKIVLPYTVVASEIDVSCATLHNAANYDFGIYNSSGVLLTHTGAIAFATTGVHKKGLGSAITLTPGVYWLAFTASNTTGKFHGLISEEIITPEIGYLTGGGSTLPATISPSSRTVDKIIFPLMVLNNFAY